MTLGSHSSLLHEVLKPFPSQKTCLNTLSFLRLSVSVKALCKECVVERCRVLRLKNQLNEDYKTVNNLLKATVKRYVNMVYIVS